jgi:hypothetical protein
VALVESDQTRRPVTASDALIMPVSYALRICVPSRLNDTLATNARGINPRNAARRHGAASEAQAEEEVTRWSGRIFDRELHPVRLDAAGQLVDCGLSTLASLKDGGHIARSEGAISRKSRNSEPLDLAYRDEIDPHHEWHGPDCTQFSQPTSAVNLRPCAAFLLE